MPLFMIKKPLFFIKPSSIAAKTAAFSNDAVTGDNERKPIISVRTSHRSHRFFIPNSLGKIRIAAAGPVRNIT